jgi:biotin transport system ATP-binding protein
LANIEIRDLQFQYPNGALILSGTSLSLDMAALAVLHGPNGSGKSTFLKLLIGTLVPCVGSISIGGRNPDSKDQDLFRELYYYPQNPLRSVLGINPAQDMEIWRLALGGEYDPRTLWDQNPGVGIDPETPWFKMSSGEARKATQSVLPAIMDRYWLMDEPLTGLDKPSVVRFMELLAAKISNGSGALIVAHEPEVFSAIRRDLYVIDNYNILQQEQL